MIDSYWLTGTTPLWTLVALGYCLAGIYLCAFDDYEYKRRVWGTFLLIGGAIFTVVNHEHIFGTTPMGSLTEIILLSLLSVGGVMMFRLARKHAANRAKLREHLESLGYSSDDVEV